MSQLLFQTISEQGSHYEVGFQRGKWIAKIPEFKKFMTTPVEGCNAWSEANHQEHLQLLAQHCPGLNQELQGMADALEVPITQMMQMTSGFGAPRACSMVAVLPERTEDHHFYMARSYEYATFDELNLSITKVQGKHAHIGFSLFQVGRFDGINDAGLCVAISSCEVVHSSQGQAPGIAFYFAVRALLDNCSTTDEAVEKLMQIPLKDAFNYMIADKSGRCVVVETVADGGKGFKAVIKPSNGTLCAFNHFRSELKQHFPKRKNFSHWRETAVEQLFNKEKITKGDLYQLLRDKIPHGLSYHDYEGFFGTLRSMMFDVSESKLWVCFGSPSMNKWFEADWNIPSGIYPQWIEYEQETAPKEFWQTVQ